MAGHKATKILAAVVAVMVMSLALTAIAMAAPPAGNKVDICHNQAKDYVDADGNVTREAGWYLINVAEKSWEKHHQKHDDFRVENDEALDACFALGAVDLRLR